jgi:hypothetical protein
MGSSGSNIGSGSVLTFIVFPPITPGDFSSKKEGGCTASYVLHYKALGGDRYSIAIDPGPGDYASFHARRLK